MNPMNPTQHDLFAPYDNMQYAAPVNGRSPPSSNRGYGQHTLSRQTSRHFDNSYDPSSYHSPFHNAQRNDTNRFDGMAAHSLPFQYDAYNNQLGNGTHQAHNNMHGIGSQMAMGMSMGSATLGASSRRPPSSRRTPISQQHWMEPQQAATFERNGGSQPYNNGIPHNEPSVDVDEELIPTAIVIKNIPFAVKKEQLTDIMSKQSLPLPYAFNYHFDSGVFRGLAFANFSTAEETAHVIEAMNHMEISGRKLRVEYKKMLPLRERERIEREKRERRGQLEEQHRPIAQGNPMLHSQSSLSSLQLNSNIPTASPSPASTRTGEEMIGNEMNMNDPVILEYYTQLMLFIGDSTREVMIFPASTPPNERRIVHTLAHQKNLEHKSRGQGDQRQVVVSKVSLNNLSPPQPPMPLGSMYSDDFSRRALNRAATTDFSSVTRGDSRDYHTLERQNSFLGLPNSPSNAFGGRQNLREAKSFADLRSHSGSPSLLTSGGNFPPVPSVPRYEVGGLTNGRSATPNLTPTSNNTAGHEEVLSGALASFSIGYSNERLGANRSNGRLNMERDNHNAAPSAIGSHRQANGTYEDRNGNSLAPERQPRIPNWTDPPFSRGRQNGIGSRGDGELDRNGSTNGWDDNNRS